MPLAISAPVGDKTRITKPDPKKPNEKFKPVRNAPADVELVQLMLVANGIEVGVDGKCGSGTIRGIREFQKKTLGFRKPDGIVDPGMRTWAAGVGRLEAKIRDDQAAAAARVEAKQAGRKQLFEKAELEKEEAATKKRVIAKAEGMIGQAEVWESFLKDAEKTMQGADTFMMSVVEFTVRVANKKAEPPWTPVLDAIGEAKMLKAQVNRSSVDWQKVLDQDKKAVRAFNKGQKAFKDFIEARIGTAGSIVGKLEVVQEISFTAVEVYITAQALVRTKGNYTAAHAIAAGSTAAMKSSAGQLGEYLAGNKVTWGSAAQKIFIETTFATIGGAVAGKMTGAFKAKLHLKLAPKLAGLFKSPAMKNMAEKFATKALEMDAVQEIFKGAAKEVIDGCKTAVDSGRPPTASEVGDRVIKIMLGAILNIPFVKGLTKVDAKAAGLAKDALQSKMIPAAIKARKDAWIKKFGPGIAKTFPKIEKELYDQFDDGIKGKVLELFVLGMVNSNGTDEGKLAKAGEASVQADAKLKADILALMEKRIELEAKKLEKAR